MEAQVQGGCGGGGGGGGGGGEVRRVHIIYFLSRKGRVEHPHLVRVHHLSRNGVRLRDVKRWLSELRGKDMPESFAWSYKRKYKAGYVWQDLLDEDLITPISDNEYVLKGSEIASTSFNKEKCSNDAKEVSTQKKSQSPHVETTKEQKSSSNGKCRKTSESSLDFSTKTSFEIEEETPRFGSETSSLTDDSSKHEKDEVSVTAKQEEENGERDKNKNNFGNAIPLASNLNVEGDNNVNNISTPRFKKNSPPPPSSASNSSIRKSIGSFSGGASHMFRNWITCRAVDTNESAVMVINRSSASSGVFSDKENKSKKTYKEDIGNREKLGDSERILAHSWLLEDHGSSARNSIDERKGSKMSKAYESGEKKAVPAAYKPINGPNCSQCGRQFRPEKLHAHMKSCRGKKAMAKSSGRAAAAAVTPRTNTEKIPVGTAENSFQNSSYYLADK